MSPPVARFTVHDAAEHWGVCAETIRRWVRGGILACSRTPTGGVRFTEAQMTQRTGGDPRKEARGGTAA